MASRSEIREAEHVRIGEVCRLTATKPFVLRYWETEFPMLRPLKTPKGHRLYRREDIALVLEIKRLLYDEGFTIAGARKHLRQAGPGGNGDAARAQGSDPTFALNRKMLLQLRDELRSILTLLEGE